MTRQSSSMNLDTYWDKLAFDTMHIPYSTYQQIEQVLLVFTELYIKRRLGQVDAIHYLKGRNTLIDKIDSLNREYDLGYTGLTLVNWLEKINGVWYNGLTSSCQYD